MDTCEIVVHEVEGQRRLVVVDFLEKALVSRVKRRMLMRIVRLERSTWLVEMKSGSGWPVTIRSRVVPPFFVPRSRCHA